MTETTRTAETAGVAVAAGSAGAAESAESAGASESAGAGESAGAAGASGAPDGGRAVDGSGETGPAAVIRAYLAALVAGDLDGIRASFAEDATWTVHGDLPISGVWRGRDRIVDDFLVTMGGRLYEPGTQTFTFPTLIAQGDIVALEWTVRARTPAGVDYDNAYCGIFEVRDGRIQAVREYFDSHYAAATIFA